MLVTVSGDVVYDSNGSYDGSKFLYMDQILSEQDTTSFEGVPSYLQTILDEKAGIIGVNIVPKTVFVDTNFSLIIFGVITLMAIICAALYLVGGRFITRRVQELGHAMKKVGLNNLSYRIPIAKNYDEFGDRKSVV